MTIAVDFDGTIVEHRYPRIGEEIPFAVETLKLLQQEKHRCGVYASENFWTKPYNGAEPEDWSFMQPIKTIRKKKEIIRAFPEN